MQLFYSRQVNDSEIWLDEEETRHATQVLRKKQGDMLDILDGKGNLYHAELLEAGKKNSRLGIKSHDFYEPRKAHIHIALAPTKNMDRTEWFVEKCVEIGIEEISFIQCRNSERNVVKTDRMEKLLVSACKQSKQFHFPRLNSLIRLEEFLKKPVQNTERFICTCENQELVLSPQTRLAGKAVLVLIGPEGDFAPSEIELAANAGFKTLSLGDSRLRTETAGVVACNLFSFLLQDL